MKRHYLALTFLAACTAAGEERPADTTEFSPQPVGTQLSWDQFRSHFREDAGRLYGEWDLSFDSEDKLRAYYVHHYGGSAEAEHETAHGISSEEQKLAVIRRISTGFEPVFSRTDALDIVYCVSTAVPNYATVVQDMAAATLNWLQSANVRFRYDATQDTNCTRLNNAVDFAVLPTNVFGLAGCGMNKMIWFTDCARPGELLVQYAALTAFPGVTGPGLLRHELGHILGFRHEHPWAPGAPASQPPGCKEAQTPVDGGVDVTGRRLTSYDQRSVMHYPQCNGIPNTDMTISALDRQGATSVYGIPAALYTTL